MMFEYGIVESAVHFDKSPIIILYIDCYIDFDKYKIHYSFRSFSPFNSYVFIYKKKSAQSRPAHIAKHRQSKCRNKTTTQTRNNHKTKYFFL